MITFTASSFLVGSLLIAIWIRWLTTGEDIRKYDDHNPRATNVLRAESRGGFLLAMILDVSKVALAVRLAYQQWGVQDWRIVPFALAPVASYTFSPFLGGNGGKALATALGVWLGLTIWIFSSIALVLLVGWHLILCPPSSVLLLATLCLAPIIVIWFPDPVFMALLASQALMRLFKHRTDLQRRPYLCWREAQASISPSGINEYRGAASICVDGLS